MDDSRTILEKKFGGLIEKKEQALQKLGAAEEKAHAAKARRNAIVGKIKAAKGARRQQAEALKKIAASLRGISEKAQKVDVKENTARLRKKLEDTEWAHQTHAGSYEKELQLWEDMKSLDALLKEAEKRDGILKEEKEIFAQLRSVRAVHDQKHSEVLSLSKEWEKEQAELEKHNAQSALLCGELVKLDTQLAAAKAEMDGIRAKERAELQMERAEVKKEEKKAADLEKEILGQKAQEVLEKVRTGKKLTGDDLYIIQKAKIDL